RLVEGPRPVGDRCLRRGARVECDRALRARWGSTARRRSGRGAPAWWPASGGSTEFSLRLPGVFRRLHTSIGFHGCLAADAAAVAGVSRRSRRAAVPALLDARPTLADLALARPRVPALANQTPSRPDARDRPKELTSATCTRRRP